MRSISLMRGRAFSMAMLPAARWHWFGIAIPRLRELRIALGRDLAAAHRLHVGHQVEQIVDGRIVRHQSHRMRAGQRQAEGELRLGEPAVELMPEQPARDQLRRRIHEEHAFPGNVHIVEPHLPVQLVVAAAERRRERIGVACRDPAADDRDAGRVHRHDERRAMPVDSRRRKARRYRRPRRRQGWCACRSCRASPRRHRSRARCAAPRVRRGLGACDSRWSRRRRRTSGTGRCATMCRR